MQNNLFGNTESFEDDFMILQNTDMNKYSPFFVIGEMILLFNEKFPQ